MAKRKQKHIPKFAQKLIDWFSTVDIGIRVVEFSVMNLVGAVIVWTVVLVPTSLVTTSAETLGYGNTMLLGFLNAAQVIGFNMGVGGLFIVTSLFHGIRHNIEYKRDKAEMRIPIWQLKLIGALWVFYLILMILVVLLEQWPTKEWAQVTARVAFTLIEIPITVMAGLRSWQTAIMYGENAKGTSGTSGTSGTTSGSSEPVPSYRGIKLGELSVEYPDIYSLMVGAAIGKATANNVIIPAMHAVGVSASDTAVAGWIKKVNNYE